MLAKKRPKNLLLQNHAIDNFEANPYLKAATSDNTRKAYRADIKHFEQWGGLLPATADTIIQYLKAHAESKNPRTLARRLIALRHWHTYQGFQDPTLHSVIKKTLIGITRIHGKPKDKAPPLLPDDLKKIVAMLRQSNTLQALRDNAIIQVGFFGGLRRSEIVTIQVKHLAFKKEGVEILLPHSKTDQTHEGQFCALPYGNDILCPVAALKNWLDATNIKTGAVFRRIQQTRLSEKALTPLSINHIVKRVAIAANLKNATDFSPHSLRRGLATSAAQAQSSIKTIMRAGRWKQVNTVMEYIEAFERFEDNAASHVLKML